LKINNSVCDDLYNEANKQFPTYLGYVDDRTNFLQEKWRLNKQDLPKFLHELLNETLHNQGLVKYVGAATLLMCDVKQNDLFNIGLEWQKVKEAYLIREQMYGLTNRQRNAFIAYASVVGDKEVARNQLAKLGDAWNECVWQEQQYFERAVNWVGN
jgi:hypothetical protein